MKYLVALLILLFLIGCSKNETPRFKIDNQYNQNLQYTKVSKLLKAGEVEVIVTATYLNSAYPLEYGGKKQNFLVNIYSAGGDKTAGGTLSLNGRGYISAVKVSNKDKIYKTIPVKNRWSGYYIYTFDDIKKDSLELKYSHPLYGETSLDFTKE